MTGHQFQVKEWKLKALADIWTGDANRSGNRLIPTSLVGSLRWWFEVLVRGLGGKACDPTSPVRCPDRHKKPPENGHHCVVCELFGCTGWARKFRLTILDENRNVIFHQIQSGHIFILRFFPLRPITEEEWSLLDLTLRLVAEYGAIGGRTVLKPSEEWSIGDLAKENLFEQNNQVIVASSRYGLPLQQGDIIEEVEGNKVQSLSDLERLLANKKHGEPIGVIVLRNKKRQEIPCWAGKRHHQDFGLIQYVSGPDDWQCCKNREDLSNYIQLSKWRAAPHQYTDGQDVQHDFSWASLQNFWCVKGKYLTRQEPERSSFNQVLGRGLSKKCRECNQVHYPGQKCPQTGKHPRRYSDDDPTELSSIWLAGCRQESKKVFSFKHPEEGSRTFGFIKPDTVDFDEIKRRLGQVWPDFQPDKDFTIGEQILEKLCSI
ncbi:MAG: type III-B CRISPR module RAMP protein Cmr1 [Thermanaeromonas sp.]|uniref:type III-B CRISPR module RAMP protein Cmr1 n=1 Tax=Thermanaeromonas sp. TaxID=2003697 RepID=UPI002438D0AE|nr:type III-B CRISPR module RAMP protein Cmr1 [Thermanaeromonas sp.]MCG0278594.1 type III-B CRISPR module RAMP protein Cmr1 [Thermanaeromonas sp.]